MAGKISPSNTRVQIYYTWSNTRVQNSVLVTALVYSDFKILVRLTHGDNGPRSQMEGLQNGLTIMKKKEVAKKKNIDQISVMQLSQLSDGMLDHNRINYLSSSRCTIANWTCKCTNLVAK